MISEAKDDLAKEIWNLPENRKFREFIAICLPSIAYSNMFYLPRLYKQYFNERFTTLGKAFPIINNKI
jgi:acetyltransferase-like isoleucine patch superfamily enzyme